MPSPVSVRPLRPPAAVAVAVKRGLILSMTSPRFVRAADGIASECYSFRATVQVLAS
jgi:hypothetical protein